MIKNTSERTESIATDTGNEQLVQSLETDPKDSRMMKIIVIAVYIVLFGLGIGTGYLLSTKTNSGSSQKQTSGNVMTVNTDRVVGSTDTKAFPDTAVGTLEAGGLDGEGTHKLIRDGGPSQTVYLVSSIVDLDQFSGKKVKIWGQTMAAKKAAWLMDVGRLELQ